MSVGLDVMISPGVWNALITDTVPATIIRVIAGAHEELCPVKWFGAVGVTDEPEHIEQHTKGCLD